MYRWFCWIVRGVENDDLRENGGTRIREMDSPLYPILNGIIFAHRHFEIPWNLLQLKYWVGEGSVNQIVRSMPVTDDSLKITFAACHFGIGCSPPKLNGFASIFFCIVFNRFQLYLNQLLCTSKLRHSVILFEYNSTSNCTCQVFCSEISERYSQIWLATTI